MSYKANTNVYANKRHFWAGEIISDDEYASIKGFAKTRFSKVVTPVSQPQGPAAGNPKADEEHPSADGSSSTELLQAEEAGLASLAEAPPADENPLTKGSVIDPETVTYNPDREYLNEAAKKANQGKNKNKNKHR